MAIDRNRKSSGGGSNPGLTPIDDVNAGTSRTNLDPDPATGSLPVQDEDVDTGTKGRRLARKKSRRKSS